MMAAGGSAPELFTSVIGKTRNSLCKILTIFKEYSSLNPMLVLVPLLEAPYSMFSLLLECALFSASKLENIFKKIFSNIENFSKIFGKIENLKMTVEFQRNTSTDMVAVISRLFILYCFATRFNLGLL